MNRFSGIKALVTSGPTRERIDPVRYISNDSSGKQGYAIAAALAAQGAEVTLVSGPVMLPIPLGVRVIAVESAEEMLSACLALLPVDIAVCAAAVADYRPLRPLAQKLKKTNADTMTLPLIKNPDILATLGHHPTLRPLLVIGFAAETEQLQYYAEKKLSQKGCDMILANNVSATEGIFNSESNTILLVDKEGAEQWPRMGKSVVAEKLVNEKIAPIIACLQKR